MNLRFLCSAVLLTLSTLAAQPTGPGYTISRTTLPFGNVPVGLSAETGFAITATSNSR